MLLFGGLTCVLEAPYETSHKPNPYTFGFTMSSSTTMSLEERYEALTRHHDILMKALNEEIQHEQECKAQIECFWKQLGVYLKQNQQANEEPPKSDSKRQEQLFSHILDSSSDDEHWRMTRPNTRIQAKINNITDNWCIQRFFRKTKCPKITRTDRNQCI